MDSKIVNDDVLPDCWIRKQSKSRPNINYYFNTATRETQWTRPVSTGGVKEGGKLSKKEPAESPKENGKTDGNVFKISNHSKQSKLFSCNRQSNLTIFFF